MNPESLIKIIRKKDKKKRTQINPQLKNLLTVKQILLASALRNIFRTLWRICILMLGWKELKKNSQQMVGD